MKALKATLMGVGAAALMLSCAGSQQAPQLTVSGLDPAKFDTTIQAKPVKLYTLKNQNGMEVCITNYGGRIVSLVVPDKDGNPTDVVLGFDNIAQYADTINTPSDYGSSVGRYANRIKNGKFVLNGDTIQLRTNDGPNSLHGGGNTGWMHQVLDAEQIGDSILKLTHVALDGENGFPGKVMSVTTYKVTADNVLDMTWEAETDKPTIINQTNHNYYNLSGDFTQPGYDMVLYVNADNFTPSDKLYIPTGEIKSVEGTPMDFRTPHTVGERINDPFEQLKNGTGYDHCYVLNKNEIEEFAEAATCTDPVSGRRMTVFTTEPGVQLYTGNWLNGFEGAHGATFPARSAICFEAQHFPDSPNRPYFPSTRLKPKETYHQTTAYVFDVVD